MYLDTFSKMEQILEKDWNEFESIYKEHIMSCQRGMEFVKCILKTLEFHSHTFEEMNKLLALLMQGNHVPNLGAVDSCSKANLEVEIKFKEFVKQVSDTRALDSKYMSQIVHFRKIVQEMSQIIEKKRKQAQKSVKCFMTRDEKLLVLSSTQTSFHKTMNHVDEYRSTISSSNSTLVRISQDTLGSSISAIEANINLRQQNLQSLIRFSIRSLTNVYPSVESFRSLKLSQLVPDILQEHRKLGRNSVSIFQETLDIDTERMQNILSSSATYKISRRPDLFNCTIAQALELDKSSDQNQSIPFIFTFLIESLYRLKGDETHQIFRVPPDRQNVQICKQLISFRRYDQVKELMNSPHLPAELLKHWLRSLKDPLIPFTLYSECLTVSDPHAIQTIWDKLFSSNRAMLRSLGIFVHKASEENHSLTNMSLENFTTILAPSILRGPGGIEEYLQNIQKEHEFVMKLFQFLQRNQSSESEFELGQ